MKLEHSLTSYTKINSKCKTNTIKLLKENVARTFFDINYSNIFFDLIHLLQQWILETKINKWNLSKPKKFCTAKETINKMKRQPIEWEKIFANDATNQWFYLQNTQTVQAAQYQKIKKKTKHNPIKKWTEELNGHFSKEDIQMGKKHIKKCSQHHYFLEKCKSKLQWGNTS